MRKRRRLPIIIVCFFSLLVTIFLYFNGKNIVTPNRDSVPTESVKSHNLEFMEVEKRECREPSYITDTSYDGTTTLNTELFSFPFRKSEAYLPNKDFIRTLSDDTYQEMIGVVNEYTNVLFNTGYRTIKGDRDAYASMLLSTIVLDNTDTTEEQYMEGLTNWYVQNKVSLESSFTTDKSLIYSDVYTYVRGELRISIFSCKDLETLKEKLNLSEIALGKPYYLVCDIGLFKDKDGYKVASYEIVGSING